MEGTVTLATCHTILLQHKLQTKHQDVTCFGIIKLYSIFVAKSIARSSIRFYFSQPQFGGCIFIYSSCARPVSCEIKLISKEVSRAEPEYMNIHPPPQLAF